MGVIRLLRRRVARSRAATVLLSARGASAVEYAVLLVFVIVGIVMLAAIIGDDTAQNLNVPRP